MEEAKKTTSGLHNKLAEVLLHEAKHDGDYHRGIDFGDGPVKLGLNGIFATVGALSGVVLTSFLAPELKTEVQLGIAFALGVIGGMAGQTNEGLAYQLDPIEIRVRRFEKANIFGLRDKLVDTLVNPNVYLNYIHAFKTPIGERFSISNRQVLVLRFSQ